MKISKSLNSVANWSLLRVLLVVNCTVVVLSVWTGISHGDLRANFDEESLITWLSMLQLLAIAIVSAGLYLLRCWGQWSWRSPALLWLLISLGFVFLAVDEFTEIHERMDIAIHTLFNIQENAITDRIDDVIVGLYGIVAAGLVYKYRGEIKRYSTVLPLIVISFIVLFVMVFLDVLTNRPDILSLLLGTDFGLVARTSLEVLEEFCKLTVGSLFLVSVCRAFRAERRMRSANDADRLSTADVPSVTFVDRITNR